MPAPPRVRGRSPVLSPAEAALKRRYEATQPTREQIARADLARRLRAAERRLRALEQTRLLARLERATRTLARRAGLL